jgi:hypothetical protein
MFIFQAMLDTRRMRIIMVYQTARAKLSAECDRASTHLRLLVAHTNLLSSLLIRIADLDQEMQTFGEELTTLIAEEDEYSMNSRPILAIGERRINQEHVPILMLTCRARRS